MSSYKRVFEHVPLLGNATDTHLEHVRDACRIYQLVLQDNSYRFQSAASYTVCQELGSCNTE